MVHVNAARSSLEVIALLSKKWLKKSVVAFLTFVVLYAWKFVHCYQRQGLDSKRLTVLV